MNRPQRILIIGALSAMAEATARAFAQQGAQLFLVARQAERLVAVAADLRLRGARAVDTFELDMRDTARHEDMLQAATAALGELDGVLIAHGVLPDQTRCQQDVEAALIAFETNASSVIALSTQIANQLESQGHGCLAVISSVAGDRGRASNYVYGAAKAAVNALCSGLRQRLSAHGVRVVTVKPGFVDTPMTANFNKGPLWAKPDAVGRAICERMQRGNGEYYLPRFWWWVMQLIQALPEPVFRRLRGL